jgi:hypothetical protein
LHKEWEEQYRGAAYTLSMAISAKRVRRKNTCIVICKKGRSFSLDGYDQDQ